MLFSKSNIDQHLENCLVNCLAKTTDGMDIVIFGLFESVRMTGGRCVLVRRSESFGKMWDFVKRIRGKKKTHSKSRRVISTKIIIVAAYGDLLSNMPVWPVAGPFVKGCRTRHNAERIRNERAPPRRRGRRNFSFYVPPEKNGLSTRVTIR